ncbi:MAG: hypothetical protein ABI383_07200 [Acidobacteriaceae bacterium]
MKKTTVTSFALTLLLSIAQLAGAQSIFPGGPPPPPPPIGIGGCAVLPANNIWNKRIDNLPVHRYSSQYISTIGASSGLHPDFGPAYGIPFITVPGKTQPPATVNFDYADESDPGPYPIPDNAPIEGGNDHHVLVVDTDNCILYEMYAAQYLSPLNWYAGSGAVFNLNSNALRPAGWTSADAAGLPIIPGLVRYDEVASGAITHALRFTVRHTQRAYVWPARHEASNLVGYQYPPMGTRIRLKASFNISGFSHQNQVILTAMKKYGMFLADNGSNMFFTGATDPRWDINALHALGAVVAGNFEVVDESGLMIDPNSGQSR